MLKEISVNHNNIESFLFFLSGNFSLVVSKFSFRQLLQGLYADRC